MFNQRPHKKLKLWEESISMVIDIYKITDRFPKSEVFGLLSQLRRAAVSVPSNITEGLTRKSLKDKLHFLNIADSSLSELDTQLEISLRLNFINNDEFEAIENKLITIQKLLSGLVRALKK